MILNQQNETCKLWNTIIQKLYNKETELPMIPKKLNKEPIWFSVVSDGKDIYLAKAAHHNPSSKIDNAYKLSYSEFEKVYPIYLKREAGYAISQEAKAATWHQVYWYSIIRHCG